MSGGSETTTTTESTREPWAPAADRIKSQVLPGLEGWGNVPQQFTGPSYIAPGQDWLSGLQGLRGYFGGGAGSGVVDPAMAQWQNLLDPSSFLNAPGAAAPMDWFAKEVGRNLDENIRPGYAASQVASGQYGGYSGTRAQQERLAERAGSEAIADFGAQLTGNLWNQGLNASQGAVGMAPAMYALGSSPYRDLMGLGDLQRSEQYTEQGMDRAREQFDQREPFNRYRDLWSIYGPAANLGGTQIGTQTQEQDMGWQNFIGPALGLGISAMTGGLGGMAAGPAMMGLGGMSTMLGAGAGGYTPFQWQGGRKYY